MNDHDDENPPTEPVPETTPPEAEPTFGVIAKRILGIQVESDAVVTVASGFEVSREQARQALATWTAAEAEPVPSGVPEGSAPASTDDASSVSPAALLANLDHNDEAAIAEFAHLAATQIRRHSRAQATYELWAQGGLWMGDWLAAVFRVKNPQGKFTSWFSEEEHLDDFLSYENGRIWRRLSEFVAAGWISLQTICSEGTMGAYRIGKRAAAAAAAAAAVPASTTTTAAATQAADNDDTTTADAETTAETKTPENDNATVTPAAARATAAVRAERQRRDDEDNAAGLEIARFYQSHMGADDFRTAQIMENKLRPSAEKRLQKNFFQVATDLIQFEPETAPEAREDRSIVQVFFDSGAFTARKGNPIDLDALCTYISNNLDIIDVYVNLDVIQGKREVTARKSWENYQYMQERGLQPMAVFHFGEPEEYLDRYLADPKLKYIGLSKTGNRGVGVEWYREKIEKIRRVRRDVKIHLFGEFQRHILLNVDCDSSDNTVLHAGNRTGRVFAGGDALPEAVLKLGPGHPLGNAARTYRSARYINRVAGLVRVEKPDFRFFVVMSETTWAIPAMTFADPPLRNALVSYPYRSALNAIRRLNADRDAVLQEENHAERIALLHEIRQMALARPDQVEELAALAGENEVPVIDLDDEAAAASPGTTEPEKAPEPVPVPRPSRPVLNRRTATAEPAPTEPEEAEPTPEEMHAKIAAALERHKARRNGTT
jgi:hypothetical protein